MTASDKTEALTHAERAALAGYVTDALSGAEQREVADHLEQCAECRDEVESLRALHEEVGDAFDAEPGPSARVRAAVFANIDSRGAGAASRGQPPADSNIALHPRSRSRAPLLPRWAPAAAIALIVIQAGLLIRSSIGPTVPSADVTARGLAVQSTRLLVVFNPQATEAQIRELLDSIGARFVGGPSSTGEYLIELTAVDPKVVSDKLRDARARPDVLQTVDLARP